jgi:two-component system response regulator CpxR
MNQLLLIDDDQALGELLGEYLELEGFSLTHALNGETGVKKAVSGDFDLVLLDVMMPGMNGFDCLRHIREESTIPVLMLTAKGDDVDKIIGLELGADDYLPKPYNERELVARIKAILRRVEDFNKPSEKNQELSIDGLILNHANREVALNGEPINLTGTEFTVLEKLMSEQGSIISREELTELALNRKLVAYDRAIDMHLSNLRKKIGFFKGKERLKTVRNAGYIFLKFDN